MRSMPMGKQQPANDESEGLGRFEREARRERWVSCVFYAFTALAFAGYLYALKVDYDESMAVIAACERDTSWKCMDAAREAYRKSRQ